MTFEMATTRQATARRLLWAMGNAEAQVVGRRVRMAREAKGMRPEDLAAKAGVGFRTIIRVENAEIDRMRLSTAEALSPLLDIPVAELRPPKIEDDEDVHELLKDVLGRLQRIEVAVGVPTAPSADEPSFKEADEVARRESKEAEKDRRRTG